MPFNLPSQLLKLCALSVQKSADLDLSERLYVLDTKVVPLTTSLLDSYVYKAIFLRRFTNDGNRQAEKSLSFFIADFEFGNTDALP